MGYKVIIFFNASSRGLTFLHFFSPPDADA